MAHLGRPKGAPDPQFSLAPVAARIVSMARGAEPVMLAIHRPAGRVFASSGAQAEQGEIVVGGGQGR